MVKNKFSKKNTDVLLRVKNVYDEKNSSNYKKSKDKSKESVVMSSFKEKLNLFKTHKYQLILILFFALSIKLVLLFNIHAFQQGDPVEYMDMAYKIAHGHELISWDIRSWFFPLILSIPVFVAKLFGVLKGDFLVSSVRLVPLIFSLFSIYLVYLIGKKLKNPFVGLMAAFLLSVNWIFNVWSISPVAGVPCAFFVLMGYYFYLQNTDKSKLLSGLMFGFAFMMRFQGAIFIIPLILLELYNRRIKQMLYLSSAFMFGVFIQGLLDFYVYGSFLHSPMAFFGFHTVTGSSPGFPFLWFLSTCLQWISLIEIVLLITGLFIIMQNKKNISLVLMVIIPFLILSYVSHKEYRYLLQLIPFISLICAFALDNIRHSLMKSNTAQIKTITIEFLIFICLIAFMSNISLISEKNINNNQGYVEGIKYLNSIHKEERVHLLTISCFVGGDYYRNENIDIIDGDSNTGHDKKYINNAFNKSDYVLMGREYLTQDKNMMAALTRDYCFVKEFHTVWLFKKCVDESDDNPFFGIYSKVPKITNSYNINFNNQIEFLGYDLDYKQENKSFHQKLFSGDDRKTFKITYYWKSLKPVNENYDVFVRFLNEFGDIGFGNDHEPFYGNYNTSQWKPGDIIKETYIVGVWNNVKPGKYYVQVGLHNDDGIVPTINENHDINYNNTFEFLG